MEFVQFHPTGMVWPPSVMGIFGDEGVRGEAEFLTNKEGGRFMFDEIQRTTKHKPPTTKKKVGAIARVIRTRAGRRELLTRDHISRCICSAKSKKGGGVRHGGTFISISHGSTRDCRTPPSTSKRNCRACYHQFKQLADIDITEQAMEVGPTTHYIMGGVHV